MQPFRMPRCKQHISKLRALSYIFHLSNIVSYYSHNHHLKKHWKPLIISGRIQIRYPSNISKVRNVQSIFIAWNLSKDITSLLSSQESTHHCFERSFHWNTPYICYWFDNDQLQNTASGLLRLKIWKPLFRYAVKLILEPWGFTWIQFSAILYIYIKIKELLFSISLPMHVHMQYWRETFTPKSYFRTLLIIP